VAVVAIGIDQVNEHVGREVAVSDWLEITQARIDAFAEATGDRQWLHVDPERAGRESPFGATVAHGFLTLSVMTMLLRQAVQVDGARLSVNYGLNRVRFVAPVPAGARIRARCAVRAVDDVGDACQVTWGVTIERDGQDKPCAVIESLTRYYRA
jgi:acyl dehydratase